MFQSPDVGIPKFLGSLGLEFLDGGGLRPIPGAQANAELYRGEQQREDEQSAGRGDDGSNRTGDFPNQQNVSALTQLLSSGMTSKDNEHHTHISCHINTCYFQPLNPTVHGCHGFVEHVM